MNKISADGRLVANAEVRYTPGGDAICSFRMASDVGFGDKKTTNWFSCTIWGKRGQSVSEFLTKGTPVTVYGTLTMREWTNKDGVKQLSPDIRVDEITMHGSRDGAATQQRQPIGNGAEVAKKAYAPPSGGGFDDLDDSIPF